jgi:hypothetical protein
MTARGTEQAAKLAEQLHRERMERMLVEEELAIAQGELRRLRCLLSAHHAAGALDEVLVGDLCPICSPSE